MPTGRATRFTAASSGPTIRPTGICQRTFWRAISAGGPGCAGARPVTPPSPSSFCTSMRSWACSASPIRKTALSGWSSSTQAIKIPSCAPICGAGAGILPSTTIWERRTTPASSPGSGRRIRFAPCSTGRRSTTRWPCLQPCSRSAAGPQPALPTCANTETRPRSRWLWPISRYAGTGGRTGIRAFRRSSAERGAANAMRCFAARSSARWSRTATAVWRSTPCAPSSARTASGAAPPSAQTGRSRTCAP